MPNERNCYRIGVVVSGFAPREISVVEENRTLTVKTVAPANQNGEPERLYYGVPARSFERTFPLAAGVSVKSISRDGDMLNIELTR